MYSALDQHAGFVLPGRVLDRSGRRSRAPGAESSSPSRVSILADSSPGGRSLFWPEFRRHSARRFHLRREFAARPFLCRGHRSARFLYRCRSSSALVTLFPIPSRNAGTGRRQLGQFGRPGRAIPCEGHPACGCDFWRTANHALQYPRLFFDHRRNFLISGSIRIIGSARRLLSRQRLRCTGGVIPSPSLAIRGLANALSRSLSGNAYPLLSPRTLLQQPETNNSAPSLVREEVAAHPYSRGTSNLDSHVGLRVKLRSAYLGESVAGYAATRLHAKRKRN